MKSLIRTATTAVAALLACASSVAAQDDSGPKLVVIVTIDQLRGDLLDHYDEALQHGLRRVQDQGYRFTNASHAHARTSTAPGHATITTGVFPSRHGIVGNSWNQRVGDQWIREYAVEDLAAPILGYEDEPELEGRSPVNMLREGLPDWMLALDDDTRVVSISRKDRAAVPMGGMNAEHVYWIVPELGQFVTSTHYRGRYPGWLRTFNERVMPDIYESEVWESEVPESLQHLARPDEALYESDTRNTVFPHLGAVENPFGDQIGHNLWVSDQPRVDLAVTELAKLAIDELDLGQRDEVDYLSVAYSAIDRVGHDYGPFSQEQLSNIIHLDRTLGALFDYLDEEVGADGWVAAFTADHGVVTIPEAQVELGINPRAKRILQAEHNVALEAALRAAAPGGGTPDDVAARLASELVSSGVAEAAYTHHDLTRGELPDSFATMFRNSYYPGRAWGPLARFGVEYRVPEGDLVSFQTGTNHESVYWYDRWVPIVFLGAGVRAGSSEASVYTVDIAPTLAALAGIPFPDDLDGRRIY